MKKNYPHSLVDPDSTLWDIYLNSQFLQQAILAYDPRIEKDEYDNMGTFPASCNFLNETLNLQLFVYYGFNNDSLIRPKVIFELLFGADIFTGTKGWFGSYKNNMLHAKIKYSS